MLYPPRSSSAANESRFVAVGIEDVYRDFVKGVLKLSLFIVAEASREVFWPSLSPSSSLLWSLNTVVQEAWKVVAGRCQER